MKKLLPIIALFAISNLVYAQADQNLKIAPTNVNCDELPDSFANADEAVSLIEKGKYRYQQDFKISRVTGFQGGSFYSCDNKVGYLIVSVSNKKTAFKDIPKAVWQSFMNSMDPQSFYEMKILSQYDPIK
ncbi:MAG: hypothetical protein AAFX87_28330 [Bacteroidota bacterium]